MKVNQSPMMKQYMAIKSRHKGAILFFRMGDFYEMFFEDAKTASKVLGLTLTSRSQNERERIPLAGFPHHQLETYLAKMLRAGYNVSICEQVEDPKKAKGLVKREVTEVVTPGSALSDAVLEKGVNNYLAALYWDKDIVGMAWADISTGEFFVTEGAIAEIKLELENLSPAEIIIPEDCGETARKLIEVCEKASVSPVDGWYFALECSEDTVKKHFGIASLRSLGLENTPSAVRAAGAILAYLKEELKRDCSQLRKLSLAGKRGVMILDSATMRNLELFESFSGRKEATLLYHLDKTATSMGARLLRKRLGKPLVEAEAINKRLDLVEELFSAKPLRGDLQRLLSDLCDIERTLARLTGGRGNPRDAYGLYQSLKIIPRIADLLKGAEAGNLALLGEKLQPVDELADYLEGALSDKPPLSVNEGGIFREGFNAKLDELRGISGSGKDWILNRQAEERARTGISSLKIGYNKVFGYYIEITKAHAEKAPAEYIRKQTLVNAERYITPELKEYEDKVLRAEEEIKELEYELFQELRRTISKYAEILQGNAGVLAELDVYLSFAEAALVNDYRRPEVVEEDVIELKECRHPVLERLMPPGKDFVPNDLEIGGDLRIMIITGPNMAGKSTYLRQVALTVLMAQAGSFVPAKRAKIGVVDRVFTRVGAQDNLAEGESTFLLEMNEAANILNHATNKSLLILDEIGRGTSTYDGLSIAWAMTEHLHNDERLRSKTLFATHYHELTELEKKLSGVKNFNILVREHGKRIIFLRKIAPGGCDRSYGIQVARMAGLPEGLIERALEVLSDLEGDTLNSADKGHLHSSMQLNLFSSMRDLLREKLGGINPDDLSAKEALDLLYELKKLAGEG